jgi:hypothetical protein
MSESESAGWETLREAMSAGIQGRGYRAVALLYAVTMFSMAPIVLVALLYLSEERAIAVSAIVGGVASFMYFAFASMSTSFEQSRAAARWQRELAVIEERIEAFLKESRKQVIYGPTVGLPAEPLSSRTGSFLRVRGNEAVTKHLSVALDAARSFPDENKRGEVRQAILELHDALQGVAGQGSEEYAESIAALVAILIQARVGNVRSRVLKVLFESLQNVIMQDDEEEGLNIAAVVDALDRLVASANGN